MTAKAIRDYLSKDLISSTAAAVAAANPTLWASAANVPDYAYKSLGSIWLLTASLTSSVLEDSIVYRFGQSDTSTKEISLFTLPTESVRQQGSFNSNLPGAEASILEIVLRLPQRLANLELLTNAELRIRYLLDLTWRRQRKGVTPFIPSTGDNTLANTGIYCQFDGYVSPPNAMESHVRFCIDYNRAVPRS